MKSKTVSGMIIFRDQLGFDYSICRIDETLFENDEFRYVFTPNYDVIDILPKEFEGIPGLDLSLRRETYVRENIMPVFIAERVPPKNRENLYEELASAGLGYYDPLEWLIRTDMRYSGDSLFVEPLREPASEPYRLGDNYATISTNCKDILDALAEGREVIICGDETVDGSDRRKLAILLRELWSHDSKYRSENRPMGRKPKEVELMDLVEVCEDISQGTMTLEQGALRLGVSRATLYRRMKQFGISLRRSD